MAGVTAFDTTICEAIDDWVEAKRESRD